MRGIRRRVTALTLGLVGAAGLAVALAGSHFVAAAAPVVTAVTPNAGAVCPGEPSTSNPNAPVTITGTGFVDPTNSTAVATVDFGGVSPSPGSYTVTPTQIVIPATAMPGRDAGQVHVRVTLSGASSSPTPNDLYTFVPARSTVNSVVNSTNGTNRGSTAGGAGTLTINGDCFVDANNIQSISWGGVTLTAASGLAVVSNSQLTVTPLPAQSAGTYDTIVTSVDPNNSGGIQSAPNSNDVYTFVTAPTVTQLSPTSGYPAGGIPITITGTGFFGGTGGCNIKKVLFGATPTAVVPTCASDTKIVTTVPRHFPSGPVDVTVYTDAGSSAVNPPSDVFTYVAAPVTTVTGLAPNRGPATSGNVLVKITGTAFFANNRCDLVATNPIMFGTTPALNPACVSSTLVTATAPNGTGSVDVTVQTVNGGTSAISRPADLYTYVSPPTLSPQGVSPTGGPAGGGTTVTVNGSNFFGGSGACDVQKVTFSAIDAQGNKTTPTATGTNIQCVSDGQLTVTSPALPPGTKSYVFVANSGGESPLDTTDSFQYVAKPPAVSGVSPNHGPSAGGQTITITGANFTGADDASCAVCGVTFAVTNTPGQPGIRAASMKVVDDHTISAVTPTFSQPANQTISVTDVIVTTATGASPVDPRDQYSFVTTAAPSVSGVSPNRGPAAGLTGVVINGSGFFGGSGACDISSIAFGGTNGGNITNCSDTRATVDAPAHTKGIVDVVVTTAGGGASISQSLDRFQYVAPPTVTAVSTSGSGSNRGPVAGGNSVTITGANYFAGLNACHITGIKFGAAPASFTGCSDTSVVATAPAGTAGPVDVQVTTDEGSSTLGGTDQYVYVGAPTVTSVVNPSLSSNSNRGPAAGGNTVQVNGSGFFGGLNSCNLRTIYFGTQPGSAVACVSDLQATITAPSGSGIVDVSAFTDGGPSPVSPADQYGYIAVPAVTSLAPQRGAAAGGNTVTVTGSGFLGGLASGCDVSGVVFGSAAASAVACTDDTHLTATSPAGNPGGVDVRVTTTGGQSPVSTGDLFTYVAAPLISSITPSSGVSTGGTAVTIKGSNLIGGLTDCTGLRSLKFGSVETRSTVTSCAADGSQLVVNTPASPANKAGAVDVSVGTDGGTAVSAGGFTYKPAPAITSLSPARGPIAGGNAVVINGSNLTGGTGNCSGVASVSFGSTTMNTPGSFSNCSDSAVTVAAPAGSAGASSVSLANSVATSNLSTYTYVARPVIGSLSPARGAEAGGNTVTINGSHLAGDLGNCSGITSVTVNGASVTPAGCGDSSFTITMPAGTGSAPIVVTTDGGASSPATYSFIHAPAISGISPSSGPKMGGTRVTISGSNLTGGAGSCDSTVSVTFGGQAVTPVSCSDSAIAVNSPASTSTGKVDLSVATVGGTATAPAAFNYLPGVDYYFAEGSTQNGFAEDLYLFMPNYGGQASVTFSVPAGTSQPASQSPTLTKGLVTVVHVPAGLPSVSAHVVLPASGVVERRLFFAQANGAPWSGSTDQVGVSQPATEWNFAEGTTQLAANGRPLFSEYLTLQNPDPSHAATVTLNYALQGTSQNPVKTLTLAPASRATVPVFGGDTSGGPCDPAQCGVGLGWGGVGVKVTSSTPIVAERPMYSNGFDFGYGPIYDGNDVFGTNAAGNDWYFAEGSTQGGVAEYLSLTGTANVSITYLFTDGTTKTTSRSISGRDTVRTNDVQEAGSGRDFSVHIHSDNPIVAERPMYLVLSFGGNRVYGTHDAVGITQPGRLFGFSAASTTASEYDYLTLGNAGATSPANVTITYYTPDGPQTRSVTVAPQSRSTIFVNDPSRGGIRVGYPSVGITLSSDQPIIVEKPTYNTNPYNYGATDTPGYSPSGGAF